MAKVDTDIQSFYLSSSHQPKIKDEKKSKEIKRSDKTGFSKFIDDIRSNNAGAPGTPETLPVSEETINFLMDDVRSCGDSLLKRPLTDEIIQYKQSVRRFMNYIVKNCFNLEHEDGIPNMLKPSYKGPRGTSESKDFKRYTKIQIIDDKLEKFAANLLTSQMPQMQIVARLEEIKGLLIDLLQ